MIIIPFSSNLFSREGVIRLPRAHETPDVLTFCTLMLLFGRERETCDVISIRDIEKVDNFNLSFTSIVPLKIGYLGYFDYEQSYLLYI